jgi:hypothetical protein
MWGLHGNVEELDTTKNFGLHFPSAWHLKTLTHRKRAPEMTCDELFPKRDLNSASVEEWAGIGAERVALGARSHANLDSVVFAQDV